MIYRETTRGCFAGTHVHTRRIPRLEVNRNTASLAFLVSVNSRRRTSSLFAPDVNRASPPENRVLSVACRLIKRSAIFFPEFIFRLEKNDDSHYRFNVNTRSEFSFHSGCMNISFNSFIN